MFWGNGPLLLILCNLFWAGSIVTGRMAAELIPPALFTALRWSGALLIVLPFAAKHWRQDWPALRRRWWLIAVLAASGIGAYNNLIYRGLHDTTAINVLLLQSAMPLLILLTAFLLFGERPKRREMVAIAVSMAGVLVIAARGSLDVLLHLSFNRGDLLILVGLFFYAVYSAMLRLRPTVHPFSLLAASFALGVAMQIPLAAVEYATGARLITTPVSIACLAYACLFPAFLAYLFFNRGVELVGAARAGQYIHLIPVFGVVLAVFLLNERLLPFHAVGVALIAAGLILASVRAARPLSS